MITEILCVVCGAAGAVIAAYPLINSLERRADKLQGELALAWQAYAAVSDHADRLAETAAHAFVERNAAVRDLAAAEEQLAKSYVRNERRQMKKWAA